MAVTPLEFTGSSTISIPELIGQAREGFIRIPHFQRPFVWDASDVRRLFDSIYRGFPIGTVILWLRDAPSHEVNLGPINFTAPAYDTALWVVDGQQRIISFSERYRLSGPIWTLASRCILTCPDSDLLTHVAVWSHQERSLCGKRLKLVGLQLGRENILRILN